MINRNNSSNITESYQYRQIYIIILYLYYTYFILSFMVFVIINIVCYIMCVKTFEYMSIIHTTIIVHR